MSGGIIAQVSVAAVAAGALCLFLAIGHVLAQRRTVFDRLRPIYKGGKRPL